MKCEQFFLVIVTIGFENTSYTIVEDIGSLEVCARVFEPNDRTVIPIERPISVVAETIAGTAGMTLCLMLAGIVNHDNIIMLLQAALIEL